MPRPDVSEERREQILDAAMIVFNQKGINGARMDDIVKESGLSKGTLYWYFKSKTDIIEGLMHRIFEQDFQALADLVKAEGTAAERLNQHMQNSMKLMLEIADMAPLVFEFYSEAARSDEFKQQVTGYIQEYRKPISTIIQQGVDSGEFVQVDAMTATITLGAMIEGTFLHHAINPGSFPLIEQLQFGYRLFLQGLRCADPTELTPR